MQLDCLYSLMVFCSQRTEPVSCVFAHIKRFQWMRSNSFHFVLLMAHKGVLVSFEKQGQHLSCKARHCNARMWIYWLILFYHLNKDRGETCRLERVQRGTVSLERIQQKNIKSRQNEKGAIKYLKDPPTHSPPYLPPRHWSTLQFPWS